MSKRLTVCKVISEIADPEKFSKMRINKDFEHIVPAKKTTHGHRLNRGIQIWSPIKYTVSKNMPLYYQKITQLLSDPFFSKKFQMAAKSKGF